MIEKLYIKDFAIVDEMEISFNEGLTVITGETGSGKSILLQALNVSLGSKASKTMVRSNSERAVVETKLNSTTYRRVINKSGRAKSYKKYEYQIFHRTQVIHFIDIRFDKVLKNVSTKKALTKALFTI